MGVVEYLLAQPHRRRHGHMPVWYNLGAGQRQCVNCLKGGRRQRMSPRLVPQTAGW